MYRGRDAFVRLTKLEWPVHSFGDQFGWPVWRSIEATVARKNPPKLGTGVRTDIAGKMFLHFVFNM